MSNKNDFFLRYYVGHRGMYGHEFIEFEFRPNGKLRYVLNSRYKNETTIRREVFVSNIVREELQRIVEDSKINEEDDSKWPEPNSVGTQELEIAFQGKSYAYKTSKIGSLLDVLESDDADGLRKFYYLIQDLKCLVFALVRLHFKARFNL
eukprot:TRINITY_DN9928_c0_g1_i1.p1 TRINITY_DN9928_c0_g1~~TRINITY_DN9928_c0_g1_i1.p1  ORF type:complete len:159 (+),score=31.15 TRINITY_DN9928_c0_g1_i1:29-478(+)